MATDHLSIYIVNHGFICMKNTNFSKLVLYHPYVWAPPEPLGVSNTTLSCNEYYSTNYTTLQSAGHLHSPKLIPMLRLLRLLHARPIGCGLQL